MSLAQAALSRDVAAAAAATTELAANQGDGVQEKNEGKEKPARAVVAPWLEQEEIGAGNRLPFRVSKPSESRSGSSKASATASQRSPSPSSSSALATATDRGSSRRDWVAPWTWQRGPEDQRWRQRRRQRQRGRQRNESLPYYRPIPDSLIRSNVEPACLAFVFLVLLPLVVLFLMYTGVDRGHLSKPVAASAGAPGNETATVAWTAQTFFMPSAGAALFGLPTGGQYALLLVASGAAVIFGLVLDLAVAYLLQGSQGTTSLAEMNIRRLVFYAYLASIGIPGALSLLLFSNKAFLGILVSCRVVISLSLSLSPPSLPLPPSLAASLPLSLSLPPSLPPSLSLSLLPPSLSLPPSLPASLPSVFGQLSPPKCPSFPLHPSLPKQAHAASAGLLTVIFFIVERFVVLRVAPGVAAGALNMVVLRIAIFIAYLACLALPIETIVGYLSWGDAVVGKEFYFASAWCLGFEGILAIGVAVFVASPQSLSRKGNLLAAWYGFVPLSVTMFALTNSLQFPLSTKPSTYTNCHSTFQPAQDCGRGSGPNVVRFFPDGRANHVWGLGVAKCNNLHRADEQRLGVQCSGA